MATFATSTWRQRLLAPIDLEPPNGDALARPSLAPPPREPGNGSLRPFDRWVRRPWLPPVAGATLSMTVRWLRPVLFIALLGLGLRVLPSAWCSREAEALMRDDPMLQRAMARGVDHWRARGLADHDFMTGAERFDGEWRFGTYMMGAMGYGQTALAHPELRAEHLRAMEECIDALLTERVRAFDRALWGSDPLDDLGGDRAHAAYLGYLNLVLSLHRHLDPASRFAALNDRISAHLEQRMLASPIGLVQTYPGQTYPVDNTAIVGSLGLHALATGADHGAVLEAWGRGLPRWRDRGTGLLIQAVHPHTGAVVDGPRGSGTALASYFLSFVEPEQSRALYEAMRDAMHRELLGFGAMREYPPEVRGRGDIDSGPVIFGVSISASGFALAGARIHDDPETFASLWGTAMLFGNPVDRDGMRLHALGGPLGDALLFALVTARPTRTWSATS